MATGETKLSYLDVVDDIQDGDTVPILRDGKNYMSTGLAGLNADLTDMDWFGHGKSISSGEDLNDYQTCGKYYVSSASVAQSLENCPSTNAFCMYVFNVSYAIGQLLFRHASSCAVHYRLFRTDTWTNWYTFTSTAVSTTSVGDPVVMGDEDNAED